ncbi:hypothetical protein TIFTF001_047294 [Ficus carica]|uniref:Uncharacterized protein n=1 Tax=Ficus carica TaxID=3494 RepID=A0AA87YTE6_FICCA|nr:hypothetical protein TIFTF001_047294 [Ficus carica]
MSDFGMVVEVEFQPFKTGVEFRDGGRSLVSRLRLRYKTWVGVRFRDGGWGWVSGWGSRSGFGIGVGVRVEFRDKGKVRFRDGVRIWFLDGVQGRFSSCRMRDFGVRFWKRGKVGFWG